MIDRDIWITASTMIEQFGDEAAIYAALRAGTMYDRGDAEGYAVWKRIVWAIDELTSGEPQGAVI
jgi:hypothetical protein